MKDISELIKKKKEPEKVLTAEEITMAAYLQELKDMKDFRGEAERISWPTPVGQKWKN